jgi:hypothetical protein
MSSRSAFDRRPDASQVALRLFTPWGRARRYKLCQPTLTAFMEFHHGHFSRRVGAAA